MTESAFKRRTLLKSTFFGTLAVATPNLLFADRSRIHTEPSADDGERFYRFPAIPDEVVSEVVGKSHSNLDSVKELVTKRPELARANWDWSFGDWESALGAASHMGRRDIADFLISYGARPNIFTFAMLGEYAVVKSMIEAYPGIQSTPGPHGISLLQHAKTGLRMDTLTEMQKSNVNKVIGYLESLGDAEVKPSSIEIPEGKEEQYLGEYKYGDGENESFVVNLNMRKMLAFARKGNFGGVIYKIDDLTFAHQAAPSIRIKFSETNGKITSLTLEEPDLILRAVKIA